MYNSSCLLNFYKVQLSKNYSLFPPFNVIIYNKQKVSGISARKRKNENCTEDEERIVYGEKKEGRRVLSKTVLKEGSSRKERVLKMDDLISVTIK